MTGSCTYMAHTHNTGLIRGTVDRIVSALTELRKRTPFDAIAFRGMSGASVCYPVSYLTGLPLFNVRKLDVSGHSGWFVEGPARGDLERYVIVDDLIASGATMREIIFRMGEHAHLSTEACAGIVLYAEPHTATFRHEGVDIPVVYADAAWPKVACGDRVVFAVPEGGALRVARVVRADALIVDEMDAQFAEWRA
jgi:adenine/guanine phosphoribosyltransferase-like PRPP-binding protein